MAKYTVGVDFTYSTSIEVEAGSVDEAEAIVLGASNESITHLQGRSYADVAQCSRLVTSIVEVS